MSRHTGIATGVAVAATMGLAVPAWSQAPAPIVMLAASAGPLHGRVQGLVRDPTGRGLADASVLAVGQTIVAARTDLTGRFALLLPPGDYVLRATRNGYLSTYREPVRVQGSAMLERNITLTKQEGLDLMDPKHAHTDMAWRLRHLPRSVLRDGMERMPAENRKTGVPALFDVSGQVNLLTTGVATPPWAWVPSALPRGVAFLELGAPTIGRGSWTLRASMASGGGPTWNVLGEYESDPSRVHAWALRVSYSTQGLTRAPEDTSASVDVRSVAGVAGEDRWQIAPGFDVTYGGRAERFDYLVKPHLVSVHAGFSAEVQRLTFVRLKVAQNMIAPGADEFLPPPTGGAWLPVEHTFEPLSVRRALRAEQLRYVDVSVAHRLHEDKWWPTIYVRGFRQQTVDQMATLFGSATEPMSGQYFIAPVGNVTLVGWGVGASAQLSTYLSGRIEYTRVTSGWDMDTRVSAVRRISPSVLRPHTEDLHDVTATLDATLPRSSTRISVAYRASTAYSGADLEAGGAGRFHIQVHQALPYRPTRESRVELLFSLRNLFRDIGGEASWYDELLTVAPPLRFMGGLQVRF